MSTPFLTIAVQADGTVGIRPEGLPDLPPFALPARYAGDFASIYAYVAGMLNTAGYVPARLARVGAWQRIGHTVVNGAKRAAYRAEVSR